MAVTSMSGTAPRSRTSTLGLVGRVDQAEHPLPETVGVGVVDGGHGPQRPQAGEGLAVGWRRTSRQWPVPGVRPRTSLGGWVSRGRG